MSELEQARSFYMDITEEQRDDLAEAIAYDIYFLDEEFQEEVITFLTEVLPELGEKVNEINDFTL